MSIEDAALAQSLVSPKTLGMNFQFRKEKKLKNELNEQSIKSAALTILCFQIHSWSFFFIILSNVLKKKKKKKKKKKPILKIQNISEILISFRNLITWPILVQMIKF